MTMPSTGALNMGGTTSPQSVNSELGQSLTATVSMNDSNVRTLAGAGGSGTSWSMNALYGKSAYTPALRVDNTTVASGQTFTVPAGTPSGTTYTYAIVAGGGGSGGTALTKAAVSRGGGGGGQVRTGTFTVSAGQVITFAVGAAGAAGGSAAGGAGGVSTIQTSTLNSGVTVSATGGLGGPTTSTGANSGSGQAGGVGSGTQAGGGGGDSAPGVSGATTGNGGAGTTVTVGGTNYTWGGGGGGGDSANTPGAGGAGGGGAGGQGMTCACGELTLPENGTDGTGGGAGGGAKGVTSGTWGVSTQSGGSGHVVIYG